MISFTYQTIIFNIRGFIMARFNQKSALAAGAFTGAVVLALTVVDFKRLTFTANVTAGGSSFDVCDDNGKIRVFGSVDNVISWLKGAYQDMTSLTINFTSVAGLTNTFVPPANALAEANKVKAAFVKLKSGLTDNKALVATQLAQAVASGWDLGTAHPALQANHVELVERQAAQTAIEAYYDARIAAAQAIIDLG